MLDGIGVGIGLGLTGILVLIIFLALKTKDSQWQTGATPIEFLWKRDRSQIPHDIRKAMDHAREMALESARKDLEDWKKEELIPGVNKFVDSQFDYISNIVKGFRGVLERLLGKYKFELANFVRNDVEKYIFVPETVKLKTRNFTEKSIRTYADNFEREIQSIQFSNGVRDVEKDLSDLCQVIAKFQCNRNIDCQDFIIGKGIRDMGVLVAGKLAIILLKGMYFPPLAALVLATDYIWHLVKKEEGKEVLKQKTLEHLDEVLKAILEGNKDSIQAVIMEMENKIIEDTLAKYPKAQPVFQDLRQQRELLLSTSSFDKEIEVEYSVVN